MYAIGEATAEVLRDLDGTVTLVEAGTLDSAVACAGRRARPGETVLLSPACASFDQYRDFEQRGAHFRALVEG